jgi:aspartyl protease family protein
MLSTANGTAAAELGMVDELHVGTIVARHLEVIVAPGMGGTNVLGMNFLSSLAEWRVEGKVLILTPHHPQKADDAAERQDQG